MGVPMLSLEELYKNLKKYSNFDNYDNAGLFLDTVGEILKYKEPSSISILLDYFDDNTDYGFVMQGMISGIESYPDEIYVNTILHEIENAIEKYPEWLTIIIYGILNNNNCFQIFKNNMSKASKESLLKLFTTIEEESSQHKKLIVELRKELKANENSRS